VCGCPDAVVYFDDLRISSNAADTTPTHP